MKITRFWTVAFGFGLSAVCIAELPAHFDLREQAGALPPVLDQGQCRSCGVMAAVSAMETVLQRKQGQSVSLSPDYLAQCTPGSTPCAGGDPASYYQMAVSPGVVLTSGFSGNCSAAPIYARAQSVQVATTAQAIKQATYDYGTVGTVVYASNDFMNYASGVFNSCDPSGEANTFVQIVGWDDAEGYWILRNSWGSVWGEQGYMRISYGCNQVGTYAIYLVD